MKLKKFFALVLTGICILGNTFSVSAETTTITSFSSQGNLVSETIPLDQEITMYGSALCGEGSAVGNVSKWSARMYGDLAITYTTGACSFGKDGSTTDVMNKAYFVIAGPKLVSYSKSAEIFSYYNWVSTRLYY